MSGDPQLAEEGTGDLHSDTDCHAPAQNQPCGQAPRAGAYVCVCVCVCDGGDQDQQKALPSWSCPPRGKGGDATM